MFWAKLKDTCVQFMRGVNAAQENNWLDKTT